MTSHWDLLNTTASTTALQNSTNVTRTRPPWSPPALTDIDISLLTLSSLLSVFIVFGNSMVLGAFKVNRRLRTTPNFFIFSLAVADLFNGLISIPLYVTLSITRDIYNTRLSASRVYGAFDIICGTASILNLTCISLERAYALLWPLQHRYLNKGFIVLGITCSWSLAGLAGIAQTRSVVEVPLHGFTLTVVYFMFPLTIIMAAYAIIFKVARAHARGRGRRSFKKDLRIAMTIAMVTGLFILFWGPFFATNSFYALCLYLDPSYTICSTFPGEISGFFKFLQCGSSACNPVIYGFRNNDFRRAFHKMFMRLVCKKVPLTHFRGSTVAAATRRRVFERQDSSFEDSRSTIYRGDSRVSLACPFDYRDSYKKAISKGCKKTKKSLKGGLLSIGTEAFFLPLNGFPTVEFGLESTTPETFVKEVSLDIQDSVLSESETKTPDKLVEKDSCNISKQASLDNIVSKVSESGSEGLSNAQDENPSQASQNGVEDNTEEQSIQRDSVLRGERESDDAVCSSKQPRKTLLDPEGKNRIHVPFKVSLKKNGNAGKSSEEKQEKQEEKQEKQVFSHENRGFSECDTEFDVTDIVPSPSATLADGALHRENRKMDQEHEDRCLDET